MFGKRRPAAGQNLAPTYPRPEAPPAPPYQRISSEDIFERVNEFDEVSIFKSGRWCRDEIRWTCTLKMGDREAGEIKFTADGSTMEATVANALTKADAARRRLR